MISVITEKVEFSKFSDFLQKNILELKIFLIASNPEPWLGHIMPEIIMQYSKRLKSEHSDFRAFQSCPIPKGFGFQMFGLPTGTKPNVRFSDDPLN